MRAPPDDYIAGDNTKRLRQGRSRSGRTSNRDVINGVPKTIKTEETRQTETAKLKSA